MIPTIRALFQDIEVFTVGQKADLNVLKQLTDTIIPLETATTIYLSHFFDYIESPIASSGNVYHF